MSKRPFTKNQIQTLRAILKNNKLQSLLLNLGVDLMLRSSDILKLKISDVMNQNGTAKKSVRIVQQKTKNITIDLPLSENSKEAIEKWLINENLNNYVFTGQKNRDKPISTSQHRRIVSSWAKNKLGLENYTDYSTHSLRKTKPSIIYNKTRNIEAISRMLGHKNAQNTGVYLGVGNNEASKIAEQFTV